MILAQNISMILNQLMQLDISVILGEEKWKLHDSLTFLFKVVPLQFLFQLEVYFKKTNNTFQQPI